MCDLWTKASIGSPLKGKPFERASMPSIDNVYHVLKFSLLQTMSLRALELLDIA